MKHYLSNVDEESQLADCRVCGRVQIYKKNRGQGKMNWSCKVARNQNEKKRRQTPKWKEYQKEYHKKWAASHPEYMHESERRTRVKRLYGITQEQYEATLAKQDNKCRLCYSDSPGMNRKRFCIDHDHQTGKVRGLLCTHCNLMLGFVKDDPGVLTRAVEYLASESKQK